MGPAISRPKVKPASDQQFAVLHVTAAFDTRLYASFIEALKTPRQLRYTACILLARLEPVCGPAACEPGALRIDPACEDVPQLLSNICTPRVAHDRVEREQRIRDDAAAA
jgi:hypothetical protein